MEILVTDRSVANEAQLGVDLVADVALALEGNHVLETCPLRDSDGWGEVIGVVSLVKGARTA